MRRTFLIITCLVTVIEITAQKISRVDFDSIKTALDARPALYKELVDRFKKVDTSLTLDEFRVLYYGQCFQDNYSPYGSGGKDGEKFKENYDKQDYRKALPFVLKMIDHDPMDLKTTFRALVCYHYLNDTVNKTLMQTRYENLLYVVFLSGDGRTNETAMVVMRVSDEYEAMRNMEVEHTSQSLSGHCDVMTLKQNDYGIEKLYFNISKPFGTLSKMFRD